jgi:hypothetical protein
VLPANFRDVTAEKVGTVIAIVGHELPGRARRSAARQVILPIVSKPAGAAMLAKY